MKLAIPILLGLVIHTCTLAAQDFSKVDAIARRVHKNDYPSPEALAQALCRTLDSDQDKARVIFTWLAENIRYDINAPTEGTHRVHSIKEYEDQLAMQAFKKGKGVCMHFAQLYKNMADAVGLECVYINGNSKGSLRGGWGSHAWNAVKIQGKWALLDATWGAGYIDEYDKFKKVFLPGFFLTPARIFILDHFPEEEKWQLLDTPIEKAAFKNQCAISYGDPVGGITDAKPLEVPLCKLGDSKIELQVKIAKSPSVIQLMMGNQQLPFTQTEKDGWLVLQFRPRNGREIEIWGGSKSRQVTQTTLMGIFPVK